MSLRPRARPEPAATTPPSAPTVVLAAVCSGPWRAAGLPLSEAAPRQRCPRRRFPCGGRSIPVVQHRLQLLLLYPHGPGPPPARTGVDGGGRPRLPPCAPALGARPSRQCAALELVLLSREASARRSRSRAGARPPPPGAAKARWCKKCSGPKPWLVRPRCLASCARPHPLCTRLRAEAASPAPTRPCAHAPRLPVCARRRTTAACATSAC